MKMSKYEQRAELKAMKHEQFSGDYAAVQAALFSGKTKGALLRDANADAELVALANKAVNCKNDRVKKALLDELAKRLTTLL